MNKMIAVKFIIPSESANESNLSFGTSDRISSAIGALIFFSLFVFLFLGAEKASALSAQVHIPEKYTDVLAGERLYFELEIKYPENPQRKDLRLDYEIKKGDEVIAQAKFLKAVETQASFMDYIVIPESAKGGMYTVNAKISDYENLSEEVATSFNVTGKNNQAQIYFFIIFGAIVILGVIIIWEINRLRKYLK